MQISSPDFSAEGLIPMEYTCDGEGSSPPLGFDDIPETAKSLVLIMEDPDAPGGTFTHWLMWNVPASTTDIEIDGAPLEASQGENDFGEHGYGAPCPPGGDAHRYVFHLYALDRVLDLPEDVTREELEETIEPFILEEAELIGMYSRA